MFLTLIIVGNILIFTNYCVGGAILAVITDVDKCSYFIVGITTVYFYAELYN